LLKRRERPKKVDRKIERIVLKLAVKKSEKA
jgi:hypothetical protein